MTKGTNSRGAILYVGSRLPELSETFVYREVLNLRATGRRVEIASVRSPRAFPGSPLLEDLRSEALVVYSGQTARALPMALIRHPALAVAAVVDAIRSDHSGVKSRAKHVLQAIMGIGLGQRLRNRNIGHVHAHMAHVPTTVAYYAARALRVPFSFTGHAADLFVDRAALRFKLERASFVNCISNWHREFYSQISPITPERLPIVRCSVTVPDVIGEGGREIVVVARLVPKKGIDLLLDAFAQAGLAGWRLRILGGGPEQSSLEARATRLGIADRVLFEGAQTHETCLAAIRVAGIFALPCRTAANGDKDGIPVVLMEAMAGARAVIAGDLPSIRELVTPGAGLLVPPDDPAALAAALGQLAADADLRQSLGRNARQRVIEEFSDDINLTRLTTAIDAAATPA